MIQSSRRSGPCLIYRLYRELSLVSCSCNRPNKRQVLQGAPGERRQCSNCRKRKKKNSSCFSPASAGHHRLAGAHEIFTMRHCWGRGSVEMKNIFMPELRNTTFTRQAAVFVSGKTWKPWRRRKYCKTQRSRLHRAAPCEARVSDSAVALLLGGLFSYSTC